MSQTPKPRTPEGPQRLGEDPAELREPKPTTEHGSDEDDAADRAAAEMDERDQRV